MRRVVSAVHLAVVAAVVEGTDSAVAITVCSNTELQAAAEQATDPVSARRREDLEGARDRPTGLHRSRFGPQERNCVQELNLSARYQFR